MRRTTVGGLTHRARSRVAAGAALVLLGAAGALGSGEPGTIDTVAGGGDGRSGAATNSSIMMPEGVATDAAGRLYVVAPGVNGIGPEIRCVDPATGTIECFAGRGDGSAGFSGDGGLATAAAMRGVTDVALDAAGNVFIADGGNYRVRRVDASTGIITTVAGIGLGYSGDGGLATAAAITPTGIGLDLSGNLYVAGGERVRRVDAVTGIITTVAGNGLSGSSGDGKLATKARLNRPTDVACDAAGNLYIADSENDRIRRVDVSTGIITTFAGSGARGFAGDGKSATRAHFDRPWSLAFDGAGSLFVADAWNHRVRRIDADTRIITTVAGTGVQDLSGDGGPATAAALAHPVGVALDAGGNVFVSDQFNDRIRRVDATTGVITTYAGGGVGDGSPAASAALVFPWGIAFDQAHDLFIADKNRVRRVDATTGIITTVVGDGTPGFSGDGGPAASARVDMVNGVAVDLSGNLFLSDSNNYRIRRIDAATGDITTVAGTGTNADSGDGGPATEADIVPLGLAFDSHGNLHVCARNRIRRIDAVTGTITTVAGTGTAGFSGDGGLATSAQINGAYDFAFDGSDNLYIADCRNHRIRRVDAATGLISTVVGRGNAGFSGDGGLATQADLNNPYDVGCDLSGNLLIADSGNYRVRRVDAATGIITTVAGTGTAGAAGDGGSALEAQLAPIYALEVDAAGDVYLNAGFRVRRVIAP